jgi:hypothetical protein
MGNNRIFFPHEALDHWMGEERVELDGDFMSLASEGHRFKLESAVRFVSEVGGGGDSLNLLGKVKTLKQLDDIGGELCAGSVIVGEEAYEVVEGFLADLVAVQNKKGRGMIPSGHSMAAATRAALGDLSKEEELDLLTRFFRQKS